MADWQPDARVTNATTLADPAPAPSGAPPASSSYAFEGPVWASRSITWDFAQSNLASDASRNAQFSSFISTSQTAYVAVVEGALNAWAAASGLVFRQVTTDSQSVDLRIGFGAFGTGAGEIGECNYFYSSNGTFVPDAIIRLEDPAQDPVTQTGSVVTYNGFDTTMNQVAAHEIGHGLGLAHTTDPTQLMYPVATSSNRSLGAGDIAGIQALYPAVACYAAGTRILTDRGEVQVQELRAGDRVLTLTTGRFEPVRWIGFRHIDVARHPSPTIARPVRITAGAFGPGLPARDLCVSPEHAIYLDGTLIPACCLVDGRTVKIEAATRHVSYYHIELDRHDIVLAEGLPAETWLDTGNRHMFDNAGSIGSESVNADGAGALTRAPRPAAIRHGSSAPAEPA